MKHESITIKGSYIENQWSNDNIPAAEHYENQVGEKFDPKAMYVVSWPDHVLTPKFNGDCDIRPA